MFGLLHQAKAGRQEVHRVLHGLLLQQEVSGAGLGQPQDLLHGEAIIVDLQLNCKFTFTQYFYIITRPRAMNSTAINVFFRTVRRDWTQ